MPPASSTGEAMTVFWVVTPVFMVFAGADSTASKGTCGHVGKITADAAAVPHYFGVGSFAGWEDCGQSTETLTCDIDGFGHRTAQSVRGSSGEVTS